MRWYYYVAMAGVVLYVAKGCPGKTKVGEARPKVESAQFENEQAPAPELKPTAVEHGTLNEGVAFYRYLIYLPPSYAEATAKWPLIVFLHGACADESLEKLKHFGPIKYARDHEKSGFAAASPATARGWSVAGLHAFLNGLQRQYTNIDWSRVYLTGYSMGGQATWMMAATYPDRFAAIAVVAGAGNPAVASRQLRHLPVWVFHGAQDPVVPVQYGWQMIYALQQAGGQVRSTIYPRCGHEAWYPAYKDPELYDWLLAQRLPER